jgi:predicted HAD superfamily phosphohydrolase
MSYKQTGRKKVLVLLDNEGPQTLNDNAQESIVALSKEYKGWEEIAPELIIETLSEEKGMTLGEIIATRFYRRLSNVDDIWGDYGRVANIDPTYSSGHAVKIALAFDKALGATSQWLYDFAKRGVRVVPNIERVLTDLDRKYEVWQISTSYEFFVKAFCDLVGFDYSKTYCTSVPRFNEVPLGSTEEKKLLAFMRKVAVMPIIKYNEETGEVFPGHRFYYDELTDFIWKTVLKMQVGEILRIVHPIGQEQKRKAVEDIQRTTGYPKEKTMYIGDSQTDVRCVEFLAGKGLTLMFNGKGKVCRIADIMYIGENAEAIKEVADLFAKIGRQGTIDYYTPSQEATSGGLLAAVTPERIEQLEELSLEKRKQFRGIHIGELS